MLHGERERKPLLPISGARANRTPISWHETDLADPVFTGTREVQPTLEELRDYVDWTFLFHAWELKGRYPAILERPEARELFDDATELLEALIADSALQPRGVYGFWPAVAEGDDVVLSGAGDGAFRFPMLRQQAAFGDSRPNRSLADYVSPAETGLGDHVGAFAVSIHGAEEVAARYESEHDDYRAIMAKALADRFAEAFAEWIHERARREWYAPEERLTGDDLIAERFRGIRPAYGYPACPDHSEKERLFELLDASARAGMHLTESFATQPAASVSGLLLGHPQARYFSIGRLGRDQVEDYAERKGIPLREAERWLSPNLAYDAGR